MGLQFGGHTATNRGGLHYMGVTHAGDTLPGDFMSCKTPTASAMTSAGMAGESDPSTRRRQQSPH